jgi:hypothetical protein
MRIRDGKIRIRDGKKSDPGSRINIPDPQHWLQLTPVSRMFLQYFRTLSKTAFQVLTHF